ncbi:aspartate 1-decarboxylase [Helicobacter winghamensis]|uniref:Aspartate 1-decarboxylase n=1 Tax=Helicobacter winghamensis TaxID=157268 RepID=A0A2N3PI32_9HELI|nr:aspartate 1-decarboxylase [Helicobacter winghamensis]EEO26112.1 aspartate 1-decarboxylase [Helicobacter winghamensis ATCC BAA-430]PKT75747.1 aspartate 1-decarboxylase [Helicobacter winghamensis]PKT75956.1 aspartate 1-decarboxylase [Helicobacter winghamensis]PKT76193.1 aspartate 1-decarboxylase [Helicobacter winghamensis]PKT80339.1 aspartate 1-decarboxylase [Helicobacter winghamensis]
MNLTMLYSKIHRASVSDANLNYVGSITIDIALMQAAGLVEGQKVDIVNINNGERFSTYVITGKSGDMCLNGAAARKVQVGDKIIVMAYAQYTQDELKGYEPKVVLVDENNQIVAIKKELGNV